MKTKPTGSNGSDCVAGEGWPEKVAVRAKSRRGVIKVKLSLSASNRLLLTVTLAATRCRSLVESFGERSLCQQFSEGTHLATTLKKQSATTQKEEGLKGERCYLSFKRECF